jgi:hypothetical protein
MSDRFETDDKAKKGLLGRGCWREVVRRDGRQVSARWADELEVSHLQVWMNRPRREMLAQERRERSR